MYCFNDKKLLDFSTGLVDLKNRTLRMQNEKTYQEDPIRILRLLKYQARYNMIIEHQTLLISQKMNNGIINQPKAMVAKLFNEIILSKFFNIEIFMDTLSSFLMVEKLKSCISNSSYHPEKSLYNHLVGSIIALSFFEIKTSRDYIVLFWSIFFHDYGKVIANKDHAIMSIKAFESYEEYLVLRKKDRLMIKKLIESHMYIREYAQANDTEMMKKLMENFANQFYLLKIVGACDYAGRVAGNNTDEIGIRVQQFKEDVIEKYRRLKDE